MIQIKKEVYERMIAHSKEGYPNEACGLLAGRGAVCTAFFPMKNVDESSISYFMDPKEQLQVFKQMRQQGLDMLGIYHSHVASEATPSQKDVRLAFYPDASTLIVSLSDRNKPQLRSFRIEDEKVSEEPWSLV
jgi:[CysO sulfur-carrier protein]-S-L-cysteine hydrolase